MKGTCVIQGCVKPVFARGWCSAHYHRQRVHGDPLGGGTSRGEPLAYLLAHLNDQTDACLIWPFAHSPGGYGQVSVDGKLTAPHIIACIHANGPRPGGMQATHGPCHRRDCFNPRHVNWGSRLENMADKLRDGTYLAGDIHPDAKVTDEQVAEIRARYAAGDVLQRELAAEYGVLQNHISRIVNYVRRAS